MTRVCFLCVVRADDPVWVFPKQLLDYALGTVKKHVASLMSKVLGERIEKDRNRTQLVMEAIRSGLVKDQTSPPIRDDVRVDSEDQ